MKKLNNQGITLIEVLVSGAILAICSALLIGGISSLTHLWNGNIAFMSGSTAAFDQIQKELGAKNTTVTIKVNGAEIRYNSGLIKEVISGNSDFLSFNPRRSLAELYYFYIAMTREPGGWDELRALGYSYPNNNFNNDAFCRLLLERDYPGLWETIDISYFKNERGTVMAPNPLYIRPHALFANGKVPQSPDDIVIGAYSTDGTRPNWNATLVLNPEDGVWYWYPEYTPWSGYKMKNIGTANSDWAKVKATYFDTGLVYPLGETPPVPGA